MKVAVVILNWNGQKLLAQFLPELIQNTTDASIYVIDNASTDDSVSFLKEAYPQIYCIENSHNWGFAKGYNEGLKQIDADLLILLNSDVAVTQNWLQPIVSAFEKDENIAIVQPKILDYNQKDMFEYAGAAGGFIDKLGYPYCRGRIFDVLEKDTQQYNDDFIFWASGACFAIKKTVFDTLNGFDTDFFAHQEEIDLCWRAHNKGYKTYYTSQSTVYHVGGATLDKSNAHKTFLNFRNSLYMLVKNAPCQNLFQILFLRLLLDGIAGIHFLIKGKISFVIAILKAHGYFYLHFIKMYKKRDNLQRADYFSIPSVVYAFFVQKKNVLS